MAEPWIRPDEFIFHGKHRRGQGAIAAAADQAQLALIFEIAIEGIMPEKSRDAPYALRGIHILIDDDGVVLRILEGDRLDIEEGAQDGEVEAHLAGGDAGKEGLGSFLFGLSSVFSHKSEVWWLISGKRWVWPNEDLLYRYVVYRAALHNSALQSGGRDVAE